MKGHEMTKMHNNSVKLGVIEVEEITEERYYYFLDVLPPIFHSNGVFQVSEPFDHTREGFARYDTFLKKGNDKFYALGIMTKKEASEFSRSVLNLLS